MRIVFATSEPTCERRPSAASRLSAGSMAVTIDTVMTLCGSMKTRCAFWYVVSPAAIFPASAAFTLACVASRVISR